METSLIIDWFREAMRLALVLGGPLLAMALLVGLVVGIGQTLTQMHEPVVGLVPRLVVVLIAVLVLLPWMIGRWVGFTGPMIESIPRLISGS